ncbi:MAG: hypothetical protein ACYDH4_12835 [Candidatus Cryosericum sp.]
MKPVLDFVGRAILPGDTVVYPWRRGSSMGLRKLTVTQVTETSVTGYSPAGRLTTLTTLANLVVANPVGA